MCVESNAYQLVLAQRLEREGMPIKRLRADKDKRARASVAAVLVGEGRVYFRAGTPWLGALEEELATLAIERAVNETELAKAEACGPPT